jgi:protease PrsW
MILELLLIILLNLIPIGFWFWFFEGRDPIPEPRELLLRTFGWGVLACVVAMVFEYDLEQFGLVSTSLWTLLCVSIIEEVVKYGAAATIIKHSDFDELIDGLVYATVAALGFAFLENIIYGYRFGLQTTFLLRGVLTTLAHVLFAAPWGVAMAVKKFIGGKNLIRQSLLLSIVFHTAFNWLLLQQETQPWFLVLILVLFISMYTLTSYYYRSILRTRRGRIHSSQPF